MRTADPQLLASAVAAASHRSGQSDALPWRPASAAQGHAGVAVLCAAMDVAHPGAGWDRAGHHHLTAAAAVTSPSDSSLFSGLAGLGFAAIVLAGGRRRYERLLGQVDQALVAPVARALRRLEGASGCCVSEFDLVSGLTGTGVYLLTRHQAGPGLQNPAAGAGGDRVLERILAGLARLLGEPAWPRRWHTPAALAAGPLRAAFPRGLHNCGLAHGVPGPLALLSLAMLAGVRVPQGADAIRSTASWLAEHQIGTPEEPDWPNGVGLDDIEPPPLAAQNCGPGRAAWCYGTPGVARSMWLAGLAAGEAQWQDLSARAIRAVAARPSSAWRLGTPAFCHGSAGLLQVLRRFAADLADDAVAAAADRLAAELAASFDPGSLLGVRSVDPDGAPVDQPGLLDGAPGIALALLGAPGPARYSPPGWDRMFLLA